MATVCSLVESEREKKSTKIVEVDVRVGSPTEDVRHELLASRHERRLPPGHPLGESPTGPALHPHGPIHQLAAQRTRTTGVGPQEKG
jgi:hypothetical protein